MDVLHAHLQKGNSACMKRPNVCGFLKKKQAPGSHEGWTIWDREENKYMSCHSKVTMTGALSYLFSTTQLT